MVYHEPFALDLILISIRLILGESDHRQIDILVSARQSHDISGFLNSY